MCPYLICALLIVGVGHLSLNRSFFIVCTVIHKYVRYLCMYYETIIWTRVGPKIQFKVFVVSRHLDIVRVLGLFVWAAHVRRMHKNTSTSACSVFYQYPTICASTHMRTIQCHINTNDIKLYQVWMAQKLEVVTVLTNIIIHIIYNNIG